MKLMFLFNFTPFIPFITGIWRRCFVSYMHSVGGMINGEFSLIPIISCGRCKRGIDIALVEIGSLKKSQ